MSDEGVLLADCIRERVLSAGDFCDRGTKDGRHLYVINQTEATAVLLETAFITNFDDETLLIEYIGELALAISDGISDFIYGRGEDSNG